MTTTTKIGLAVLGLLSLTDVAAPLLTDGEHPPLDVAILACVLGLLSVALLLPAWWGRRWAALSLAALRGVSALSAVPAFLVPGVPLAIRVWAAAGIVLTGLGIVLTLARRSAAVLR